MKRPGNRPAYQHIDPQLGHHQAAGAELVLGQLFIPGSDNTPGFHFDDADIRGGIEDRRNTPLPEGEGRTLSGLIWRLLHSIL